MASTTPEPAAPGPDLARDRYGRRRRRRMPGWAVVAGAAVVVLGVATVYAIALRDYSDPPLRTEVTSFEVIDAGSVRMTFRLIRNHPDDDAVCIVRSRSEDGDDVGRREVYFRAGPSSSSTTTILRTSRRAVTAEVYGCSYTVPEYLYSPSSG